MRVVDRHGAEALGCVHHGARLLASIRGGRVYYVSMPGAAIDTYNRAQVLPPFPWIAEAGR